MWDNLISCCINDIKNVKNGKGARCNIEYSNYRWLDLNLNAAPRFGGRIS